MDLIDRIADEVFQQGDNADAREFCHHFGARLIEECAKVCDADARTSGLHGDSLQAGAAMRCAMAIRALTEKP